MSIARWTRPPERAAKKVSCKSLGRPPSTGIIRPTGLTLLGAGAEEDFVVSAEGDVGDGFVADMWGDVGDGFVADTEDEASEDFGVDSGEDVDSDFGSGSGGDVGGGGRGVKIDARGNRTLHAARTGGEDES